MKFTSGLPETACGAGSTLKTTENLRLFLPNLLETCGIRRLIDAPCGDGNWISHTNLTDVQYVGIDISRENLAKAIGREPAPGCKPKAQMFMRGDVETIAFPRTDAVLCRDFFQHLPTAAVLRILAKFERSQITWLLATSFDNKTNDEIGPDGFRPLNLEIEPFHLGSPEHSIPDPPNSGRILGAWRL